MAHWCERFIRYHGKRHPREMGIGEVGQFLEHLAQTESDPVRALAAGAMRSGSWKRLESQTHEVTFTTLGKICNYESIEANSMRSN
jgi:hypothetical protein